MPVGATHWPGYSVTARGLSRTLRDDGDCADCGRRLGGRNDRGGGRSVAYI